MSCDSSSTKDKKMLAMFRNVSVNGVMRDLQYYVDNFLNDTTIDFEHFCYMSNYIHVPQLSSCLLTFNALSC